MPQVLTMRNMILSAVLALAAIGGGATWYSMAKPYPFESVLRDRSADPAGAQLRGVIRDPAGFYCGEINLKNRVGGFDGFEQFEAADAGAGWQVTLARDIGGIAFPTWCR